MKYAVSSEVNICLCRDKGPMAMMFCQFGHMTECHFPLNCSQAACSHLSKYDDYSTAELAGLEELTVAALGKVADSNCEECQGAGFVERCYQLNSPFPAEVTLVPPEIEVVGAVICNCVTTLALRGFPAEEATP